MENKMDYIDNEAPSIDDLYYDAPPLYAPVVAQPVLLPTYPLPPAVAPIYPVQPYLHIALPKAEKWSAPVLLVFVSLIICFPIGLILLLFFTRWGFYPKLFISLFGLLCIWALYEVLCFYSIISLPSLIAMLL